MPEAQRTAGLALPANVTARMRALVAEWAAVSPAPAAVVQAGLRHFNQEAFYYSLRPPRLGDNPADEFLFETRKGFCEHYASSFALLMRIAGIPARIVMGFLGGERNPLGAHLIVRQSDAHAWVEVWLEGQGWTRVDPTAAVAPERIEPSPELTGLASGRPLRLRIGGRGRLGADWSMACASLAMPWMKTGTAGSWAWTVPASKPCSTASASAGCANMVLPSSWSWPPAW